MYLDKSNLPYRYIFLAGIVFLVFWGSIKDAVGQTFEKKPELEFQRIHEGLLSNSISSIYQDRYGYIWVGTYSGLHRYDGIEFHIYTNSSDTMSISDNFIGAIYEDRRNNLWVGTGSGICRYDRATDSFERFELESNTPNTSSEENIVNTILEDEDGQLWIAGGGDELYYFNRERQEFISSGNFSDWQVNSMVAGDGNILWIASLDFGLSKFNTNTGKIEATYTNDPSDPASIASDDVYAVAKDGQGTLWIGTRGSGLDRMVTSANGRISFRHYLHQPDNSRSLGNDDVFTLYVDRGGKLWVGNENGGLHLYDRNSDTFFRYESDPADPRSLTHNSIWCIFEDRQGRYWVGTGLTGLNVTDPYASKFSHYQKSFIDADGLNNEIIRDFLETDEGNVWVGTDGGGLNYFDRKTGAFTAFKHDPYNPYSLKSDAVIDISRDETGTVWVGTWAGGLSILEDKDRGGFISFQEKIDDHQYPMRNVFDVHFDQQYDYTWVPAFGEALYRYDEKNGALDAFYHNLESPDSLSSNFIVRMFEDSDNNIWIATTYGLNLLRSENKKEGIFRKFMHDEKDSTSIPSDAINQIYEDHDQTVWIATSGGLAKYREEDESFKTYRKTDGLPSDEVKSVIEDDNGFLWVGTIKGISKFDPQNETFKNFNQKDGLQGDEFSRYSVHKLSSGELLFGGMNGFNLFHPDSVKNNPHKPPVYFSDFRLFNSPVNIGDKNSPLDEHIFAADTVTLAYNQSVFTFEFIALNYTKPEQNQYAFKMEGFEDKWNYVGTQRNATYTNLDPGTYTFRVKASNNDGIWNEEGASLKVVIIPPFWQTSWFYGICFIVIAGFIVGGYRYRVRTIRAQNKYLEQEVASRTSELNKKNEDLEAALEELRNTKNELVEKAHKAGMADIATGVLHNVGNILNSVNTSASLIENTLRESKLEKFVKANSLLREQIDRIEELISEYPRGIQLLHYYLKLEEPLKKEQVKILKQSERLTDKITLINEVIAAQQNYAGAQMDADQIELASMIDDALALQAGSIDRHGLNVVKNLNPVDPIVAQRSKLVHVLVNLIKNAKEAMSQNPPEEKVIEIETWQDQESVYLSISDNGSGISREDLGKIFSHGFTTKKSGHGFGLHSCANYMKEMGGDITVESNGDGVGSTFILAFSKKKIEQVDQQSPMTETDNIESKMQTGP